MTDATYEHLIEIGAGALRQHWSKRNSDQPSILYEPEVRDIIAAIAEHVTMFPRDLLSEMSNRKKGPAFSEEAFDTFLAMAETFDVSRPAPVKPDLGSEAL